jgi:hypothetical protein
LSKMEQVRSLFGERNDISEIQVEYLNGEKEDYSFDVSDSEESLEDRLNSVLNEVNWDEVDEVEVEYEDGSKEGLDWTEEEEENDEAEEAGLQAAEEDESDDDEEEEEENENEEEDEEDEEDEEEND